jgi:hypothetical protein
MTQLPVEQIGRWPARSAICEWAASPPTSSLLAHELVDKLSLGLNLHDPQRWG